MAPPMKQEHTPPGINHDDDETSPHNDPPPHGAAPVDNARSSPIDIVAELISPDHGGAQPSSANWREVFLRALAKAPLVSVAIRLAGVSRTQAFEERYNDPTFARQWDEAMEQGIDQIMAAAYLSAVYGESKPLYRQNKHVGWSTQHSRPMQAMLLQAFRPEVFGKKKQEPKETPKTIPMTLEEFRKRCEEAEATEDSEQV